MYLYIWGNYNVFTRVLANSFYEVPCISFWPDQSIYKGENGWAQLFSGGCDGQQPIDVRWWNDDIQETAKTQ